MVKTEYYNYMRDALGDSHRKLILMNNQFFKQFTLTDNQLSIIKYIKELGDIGLSAREYSDYSGKSIQSISQQLTRLWQKGYLSRCDRVDSTGGIYRRYVLNENLSKR